VRRFNKPLAVSDFDFAELMEDRNSSSRNKNFNLYKMSIKTFD
jgi:hypothetical protein